MLGDMSCDFSQTNSIVEVALALQTDVTSARSSWEIRSLLDGARAPPCDHLWVRTAGLQQREQRTAATAGISEGQWPLNEAFQWLKCLTCQPSKVVMKHQREIHVASCRKGCEEDGNQRFLLNRTFCLLFLFLFLFIDYLSLLPPF